MSVERDHKARPGARRIPTATGGITRLACERMIESGIDPTPIINRCGLTRGEIKDTEKTIRVRDQIRFLNEAAAALGDDLLGFHLAQKCEFRSIGLYYYVLASSNTLIEALQRAARYTSIVNEGVNQRCEHGDRAGMRYSYVGVKRHDDRHQIEFWIAALIKICRQLIGRKLNAERVSFVHHRPQTQEIARYFGCEVEFGADRDEIVFPADARDAPVVSADPYLNRVLVGYCDEAVAHRATGRSSFATAVENAITPLLPHGMATVSNIASELGTSQRTFARRLAEEGTSFSEIFDKLRADLADRYLAERHIPISQIAWLLGYREVASFSKAHRRWTGKTPRDKRSDAERAAAS